MFTAEDSWLFQPHPACHLPGLNHMSALLQRRQQNVLPSSMNHCTVSADVPFPGFEGHGLCDMGTGQTSRALGLIPHLPPHLENLPSAANLYVQEERSGFDYGYGIKATPNAVSGATPRNFVIFDQSGNQTRLAFVPVCPRVPNPIVAPTKSFNVCHLRNEGEPAKIGQDFPTNNNIRDKTHENEIIGEESEMHEDTEEINALLYSDDDDDDGDDSEADEVTSTDRSPLAINGSYKKCEDVEEISAETGSSDCPVKRQRLLDGRYKKSSLMDKVGSVKLDKSCEYVDDAESSCANCRTQGEDLNFVLGTNKSKKDKIRETLKALERLVPGVKSKDPLLVIEEAIGYLKYLKLKAQALGVC